MYSTVVSGFGLYAARFPQAPSIFSHNYSTVDILCPFALTSSFFFYKSNLILWWRHLFQPVLTPVLKNIVLLYSLPESCTYTSYLLFCLPLVFFFCIKSKTCQHCPIQVAYYLNLDRKLISYLSTFVKIGFPVFFLYTLTQILKADISCSFINFRRICFKKSDVIFAGPNCGETRLYSPL